MKKSRFLLALIAFALIGTGIYYQYEIRSFFRGPKQGFLIPASPIKDPFAVQYTYLGDIFADEQVIASADRKNFAYFKLYGDGYYLNVNGKKLGKSYSEKPKLKMSPDGRNIAFFEQDRTIVNGAIIMNGKEFAQSSPISNFYFDPKTEDFFYENDDVLYRNNQKIFNLPNGSSFNFYSQFGRKIYTSPSGKYLSFSLMIHKGHPDFKPNRTHQVFFNGKFGPYYEEVDDFQFSPEENTFCYRVTQESQQFYVCNGKESKKYDQVGSFKISPKGDIWAYRKLSGKKVGVVIEGDNVEAKSGQGFEYNIQAGPVFSPDGQDVLYTAKQHLYVNHQSIIKDDYVGAIHFVSPNIDLSACKKGRKLEANSDNEILFRVWSSPEPRVLAVFLRRGNKNIWLIQGQEYELSEQEGQYTLFGDEQNLSPYFLLTRVHDNVPDQQDRYYTEKYYYLINGRAFSKHQPLLQIMDIGLSSDKRSFVYFTNAQYNERYFNKSSPNTTYGNILVVNGSEIEVGGKLKLEVPPKFSPDGKTIGYFVQEYHRLYWVVTEVPEWPKKDLAKDEI
ncbi:MAG: hypothetical protein H7A32_03935 [Deltaproteobacteria bacterium]|nr:hypothetical protein [Deltaproteobacteria bacterium]